MTKTFKAGDRVRCIESSLTYGNDPNAVKRGEEYTVTRAASTPGGTLDLRRDNGTNAEGWFPRRFELVEPSKKLTLTDVAVGDTVRLLPPSRPMNAKAGATARVVSKEQHTNWLRLEWDRSNALSGEQSDGRYPVSDFEIVPKTTPDLLIDLSKLKVGDRVTVTQTVEVTALGNTMGTVYAKTISGAPINGYLTPGTKYVYTAFTPAPKADFKAGDKVTGKHTGRTGTIKCIAAGKAFVEWTDGTAGSPPLRNLLAA